MENKVREDIIEWVVKPENEDLLETLRLIKESTESKDWYDDLDEQERQSIERGKKDIEDGNVLSSKEFWKEHGKQ